jgi:hypothetical protein
MSPLSPVINNLTKSNLGAATLHDVDVGGIMDVDFGLTIRLFMKAKEIGGDSRSAALDGILCSLEMGFEVGPGFIGLGFHAICECRWRKWSTE